MYQLWTFVLLFLLLTISYFDLKYNHIPEKLIISTALIALCINISEISLTSWREIGLELRNDLYTSLITLLVMILIKMVAEKIINRKALGIGDVKLATVGGAFLGLKGIYIAMFIAFLISGIYSSIMLSKGYFKKFQSFAFAPFISFGILIVWIFGIEWWIQK